MRFLGAWNVAVTYVVGDLVNYDGSTYLASTINLASQPDLDPADSGDPDDWELLFTTGVDGQTGPTTYQKMIDWLKKQG